MKAEDPSSGQTKYFVDKCLPFGASISCAHFQRFSDALCHLTEHRLRVHKRITNYLDDFLFIARMLHKCNYMITQFLQLCEELGVPVSMDKTEWASDLMIFLGILLDGNNLVLALPAEKRRRAIEMLEIFVDKSREKATVKQLQKLCGFLNFINKAVLPGRTFTRRMYAKYSDIVNINGALKNSHKYKWKQHYHVTLDNEFQSDCQIWLKFLESEDNLVVYRPMIEHTALDSATEIGFYSNVSANPDLGFGAILKNSWIKGTRPKGFINEEKPSIEFLELFALAAGILSWQGREELRNKKIILHCDNMAMVHMVNNMSSGCKYCMVILRLLTLNGLLYNRRLAATYVNTKTNGLSDSLSRNQLRRFRELGPAMNQNPDAISQDIWPIHKIWGLI